MRKSGLFGLVGIGVVAAVAAADLVAVTTPSVSTISAPAATGAESSLQGYIDQGKYYLVQHNILAARDQFKLAVQADSTSQEANLLYGVTRVCAVVEEGQSLHTEGLDSVREILELAGFTVTQLNIYDGEIAKPEELASTTPNTGAIIDFLKTILLPEVNGAITNLSKVTTTSFTSIIDTSAIDKASGSAITVDYADALVIRALLQAVKCNLELLQVYGLNVNLPSIQAAPEQLMTYKQFFQDSTFLTPRNAANLATAKTALISFIDTYASAAQYLKNRAGSDRHLFVIDVPVATGAVDTTSLKLDKISSNLAAVKSSLNSGTPYLLPAGSLKEQDRFVDLSRFFNSTSPINFRAQLANCTTGTVLADPTVGGLFPLGLSAALDPNELPSIAGDILGVACSGRETPQMKVDQEWLELADTDYYSTGPQSFTISNQGTANLTVASITLKGVNADHFSISSGTCASLSPTLPPGTSCSPTVSLKSSPFYQYPYADVMISSTDVSAPLTFVELWGYTRGTNYFEGTLPTKSLTIARTGSGSVNYEGYSYYNYYWDSCSSASCGMSLPEGTYMELYAVPASGSLFTGWSGCDTVDGDTCYVRMYSAKAVTANFATDSRTLSVMASPPGGNYGAPQAVTLATNREAAIHYTLDGSTPNASSPLYSGPLTISAPLTLKFFASLASGSSTAAKSETYSGWQENVTLTVATSGTGGGTINSIEPLSGLITCSRPTESGDRCAATLPYGSKVTLSALADYSSLFSGWSFGGCPGSDFCSLTLTANRTLTGAFTGIPAVKLESPGFDARYYSKLLDGISHAQAGSIIRLQSWLFQESLLFTGGYSLGILGGYDNESFSPSSRSGFSTILTPLTIGSGSLTLDNIIVQ